MTDNAFQEWQTRWQEGQIGFHRDTLNPHLAAHIEALQWQPGKTIAVPLCGKSLDLVWLYERGWSVTGIEFVPKAINDFFIAWDKEMSSEAIGHSISHQHDALRIVNADIFDLPTELFGQFDAIYDRAALIALRPEQRKNYIRLLQKLLKPEGKLLLMTYETPTDPNKGPPYSVDDQAMKRLFSKHRTTLLNTIRHVPETEPKLKKRGIDWSIEKIWLVEFT